MPSYNYECIKCSSTIKVFQKMEEKTLEYYYCQGCGKDQKVRRVISGGSGMIFKGSGFYLTDYTQYGKKKEKVKENKPREVKKKEKNKD